MIKFSDWQELGHQVSLLRKVADKVFSDMDTSLRYKVGTMIEVPRAALVAGEVSYGLITVCFLGQSV